SVRRRLERLEEIDDIRIWFHPEEYVSMPQTTALTGISPRTLRNWVGRGELVPSVVQTERRSEGVIHFYYFKKEQAAELTKNSYPVQMVLYDHSGSVISRSSNARDSKKFLALLGP